VLAADFIPKLFRPDRNELETRRLSSRSGSQMSAARGGRSPETGMLYQRTTWRTILRTEGGPACDRMGPADTWPERFRSAHDLLGLTGCRAQHRIQHHRCARGEFELVPLKITGGEEDEQMS